MSGKAPYFPNNWKRYKAAPAELFDTVSFMEIMQWKIACWEIPADVFCIIRTTHLKTLKVKEYVYKRQHAAEARIESLMGKRNYEFIVCTHDEIYYAHPHKTDESDDV